MILAAFEHYPSPLAAMYNECNGNWVAAVPQVEPFEGVWNDWYFENETFEDSELVKWADISLEEK